MPDPQPNDMATSQSTTRFISPRDSGVLFYQSGLVLLLGFPKWVGMSASDCWSCDYAKNLIEVM